MLANAAAASTVRREWIELGEDAFSVMQNSFSEIEKGGAVLRRPE
jgi:hypothetical protein